MSGSDALTGAVVRVMQTPAALDHIQELHVRALGVSAENGQAARVAYADLSEAICAALGQLAATSADTGRTILGKALAAANRRGVDGVESILLSAFLSAVRNGFSAAEVGGAAAVWLKRPFPDRLAGGARRVPLLDAARLAIGSVSASELAFAVQASAGSAGALVERLQHLVGQPASEEEALEDDDPTLEPVARACADAFAATTTAGRLLDPSALGPSPQLQSGKALALAIGVAGTAAAPELADTGPIPAGLTPRPRRDLATINPTAPRSHLVPAQVTNEPPTWFTVSGRTAELDPPRALRPSLEGPSRGETPSRRRTDTHRGTPRHIPDPGVFIITGGVTTNPLTGQPVHPITGEPIGPSPGELAEATMLEAQRLDIDVLTATVADVAELLVAPEA